MNNKRYAKIVKLLKAGKLTQAAIAQRVGIDPSGVSRIATEHGLETKHKRPTTADQYAKTLKLLRAGKLGQGTIANRLGVGRSVVEGIARKHGLQTYTRLNARNAKIVKLLKKENLSYTAIEERLRLKPGTVSNVACKYGIKRQTAGRPRNLSNADIRAARDAYLKGATLEHLAQTFGVAVQCIRSWVRIAGVDCRAVQKKRTADRNRRIAMAIKHGARAETAIEEFGVHPATAYVACRAHGVKLRRFEGGTLYRAISRIQQGKTQAMTAIECGVSRQRVGQIVKGCLRHGVDLGKYRIPNRRRLKIAEAS